MNTPILKENVLFRDLNDALFVKIKKVCKIVLQKENQLSQIFVKVNKALADNFTGILGISIVSFSLK